MQINSSQLHCARIVANRLALDNLETKTTSPIFHILAFRHEVSRFMSPQNSQFCLELLSVVGEMSHKSNGWYVLNQPFHLKLEGIKLTVGLSKNAVPSEVVNAYSSDSNNCIPLLNWLGPPFIREDSLGEITLTTDTKTFSPDSFELDSAEWFKPRKMISYAESWEKGEQLFQTANKANVIGRIKRNYSIEYFQLNSDSSLSALSNEQAKELLALQWYYTGNDFFLEKWKSPKSHDNKVVFKMLVPSALIRLITLLSKSIKFAEGQYEYTLSNQSLNLFIRLCKNRISWSNHGN
jgi:hypothetical protein